MVHAVCDDSTLMAAHDDSTLISCDCVYRLYALVRMVEVVLTNLQRIDQLWPIFLSHVMELLAHAKPSIRSAAVDALTKAVVGALSHVNALADGDHEKVILYVSCLCNSACGLRSGA